MRNETARRQRQIVMMFVKRIHREELKQCDVNRRREKKKYQCGITRGRCCTHMKTRMFQRCGTIQRTSKRTDRSNQRLTIREKRTEVKRMPNLATIRYCSICFSVNPLFVSQIRSSLTGNVSEGSGGSEPSIDNGIFDPST